MPTARVIARISLTIICGLLLAMWVYAFGFASRESANRIKDTAWMARAQAHCKTAEDQRFSMQDMSKMDPTDMNALKLKSEIVDRATTSLETAINLIAADRLTDAKGQSLVPLWIADYRIYIQDRRDFAVKLRTVSKRPYFSESVIEGVPISEKIGKFARENSMKTCQPPYDLST